MTSAIAAMSILFVFPWSADAYLLPKMLAISLLLLVASFRGEWHKPKLFMPGLIGLGAVLLCSLLSRDPIISLLGKNGAQFYSLLPLLLVFLVYLESSRCRDPRLVGWTIGIAGAIAGFMAILEPFGIKPLNSIGCPAEMFGQRAASTIGNPVMLGFVLTLCLLGCVSCLVDRVKQGAKRANRWFGLSPYLIVCLGLILCGIVATQTRGALLGLGIGLLVMFRNKRWITIILFLVAFGVGGMVYSRGSDIVNHSDSDRLVAWRIALETFIDHPVLGSGPSTFMQEYAQKRTINDVSGLKFSVAHECAHNLILQVASTMGLIGLAALGWLVFNLRGMTELYPVFAAFGVCSFVGPTPWMASVLLAILVGVSEAKCKSQK